MVKEGRTFRAGEDWQGTLEEDSRSSICRGPEV